MKITIKAYEFMNNLYLTKQEADFEREGWEHKEKVKTVYLSIDLFQYELVKSKRLVKERVEWLESLGLERYEFKEHADSETDYENSLKIN